MKLFSRRRWGLVSAQQVNYFLIKWHNNTFILLGTITQFVSQLGRYKPSSPSTKQHHALTDSHRRILGKNIEVYESSEAHTSTHSLSLSLSLTHTHTPIHTWAPKSTHSFSLTQMGTRTNIHSLTLKWGPISVTRKKSPKVFKTCPKMISLEKW